MYKIIRSATPIRPLLTKTLHGVFVLFAAATLSACNLGSLLSSATTTTGSMVTAAGSQINNAGTSATGSVVMLSGSVGDGPITGATVTLTDADGNVIATSTSNAFADYAVAVPGKAKYPITIEASGGTDVVTGTAPTFTLLSMVTAPNETQVNINPFSTLIVKTAQHLVGHGSSRQNLQTATQYVLNTFNAGLDTALVPDPIATPIGDNNVATMIKASEVLAEIIRRTRTTLQASGTNLTDDDVINALAADLADGVLDGSGAAGTRNDVSLIAAITSGQVLIEALSNNLEVNGAGAAALLDSAIRVTSPGATQTTADLPVTATMLAEAELGVQAAQQVSGDTALADLETTLGAVTPGMTPTQAGAIIPSSRGAELNNAVSLVPTLTAQQLAPVDDWLRAAQGAAPPVVTLTASPSTINSGDSVTLTWSYTINADCTTAGPVTWLAPATAGSITVGPLTTGGTFTLTCTNSSGTPTSASATVTVNPPPSGGTGTAPAPVEPAPAVTLTAAPSKINPGDSVTLSWSYTAGAVCTTGGPVAWSVSSSSGQTSVGPLSAGGTFTLSCSNSGGDTTGAASVILNAPPTISAGPTASPNDIGEDQTTALTVTASDPNGDSLTYNWQASSGTITGSGAAVTFNPPAVTADTVVHITVTVTDPLGLSATGAVDVTVRNVAPSVPNIGPLATATASSENASTGQTAMKAVDGVVDGFPGDYTKEWTTVGGKAGSWIRLDWSTPYAVDHVVLHDRPNLNDQITSGTLVFSDGSSVPIGALPNDDTGLTVSFTSRTVTWITFSVNSVSSTTGNVGLAELEVYGSPAQTSTSTSSTGTPPANLLSPTQLTVSGDTASSYDTATNQAPANAVDGNSQTAWSVVSMPQWIVLDLGGQQLLSSVKMLLDGTNGGANFSYTVATSLDNVSWTQVFQGTSVSIAPQWTEADFGPVYARYVRVNLNSTVSSDTASVYEIVPNGRDMTALGGVPTNSNMTVYWRTNTDIVDGYILYFGASADTVSAEATKVTNSSTNFDPTAPSITYGSWSDFGLLPGDTVCFKVTAYNVDGVSGLSPAVCNTVGS